MSANACRGSAKAFRATGRDSIAGTIHTAVTQFAETCRSAVTHQLVDADNTRRDTSRGFSTLFSKRVLWSVDGRLEDSVRKTIFPPVMMALMLLGAAGNAAAATIFVTTTEQKISSTGGCSLQEAISSANFDDNVAIVSYASATDPTPAFRLTRNACRESGDDTIVLPGGGAFSDVQGYC